MDSFLNEGCALGESREAETGGYRNASEQRSESKMMLGADSSFGG